MIEDDRGCIREEERGVYSKKSISHNAKPSSDTPQTKQTKHLIRLIVRHSSAECMCMCVCANEGTLCGQQCSLN